MKNLKQYLALFLAFVMVLMAASCNGEAEETNGSKESTKNVAQLVITDKLELVTGSYYRNSKITGEALEYLKDAIQAVYGVEVTKKADTNFQNKEGSFGILVGDTKFEESTAMSEGMKINDYAYKVASERLVIINGGSSEAMLEAVKKFCTDFMGYTDGEVSPDGKKPIAVGVEYKYTGEYEDKSVKVNGIPIEEYKISVSNQRDINAADKLISELGKHNGFSIPIITTKDITGEEKGIICLGSINRGEITTMPSGYLGYKAIVSEKGGYTIGVMASNTTFYDEVIAEILDNTKVTLSGENVSVTLPKETMQKVSYAYNTNYSVEWTLDETKTKVEKFADGIQYKELYYTGTNDKPYVVNVMYVDTDIYTFRLGTPRDEIEFSFSTNQTLTGQMQAAINNGHDIVAGVNGDLWASQSNPWKCHPRGLTIKEGTLLGAGGERSFGYFGVTKDGEFVIGESGQDADKDNMYMAVGGSHLIVKDGAPLHFNMEDSHCYISHPRTLVGLTYDGDIILVTVDGRQSKYSNGATMEMAATLMVSLGAYQALSVDGGGSSTMAIKKGTEFEVKNSPSDGSQRAIINSILIEKKK